MGWQIISCPDGAYEMEPEGVTRLIRSYAYAKALDKNSAIRVTEHHIVGPDIESVEIDWNTVASQRDFIANHTANDFYLRMSTGWTGQQGIEYLEGLVDQRDDYTNSVHKKQKEASKRTMAQVERSVHLGEAGEAVARFVRDAAAETELALVTGGTANGAAAFGIVAGSAMKGAFKYEDTVLTHGFNWGDKFAIGQGIAEGSIELVVNVLSFGMAKYFKLHPAAKAEKITMALVFGQTKGALKMIPNSFVHPDDLRKGKKKSAAELLIPAASNVPGGLARPLLGSDSKWALPASVVLKLALRYGSQAAVAATKHNNPSPTSLVASGRVALHSTKPHGVFDCARPAEDFVLQSALRPLFSL